MGADIRIALTLFTVLVPAGAVAYGFLATVILRSPKRSPRVERLEHYLIIPLALCLVGLIASATHLGTPSNALYVLTGWGRSPLSNEVVAALGFLFLAGIHWLTSFRNRRLPASRIPFFLSRLWLLLTCAAALWLVAMISVVYAIPTIPTWDNPLVPLGLWTLALSTGPLTAACCLNRAGIEVTPLFRRLLFALSALGFFAALAVALAQNANLAQFYDVLRPTASLVPWYPWCIFAYGVLGGAALVVQAITLRSKQRLQDTKTAVENPGRQVLAAVSPPSLMLLGAAAIRVAFYAMHTTVGL
jgi:DMSO reductase anchor subunit